MNYQALSNRCMVGPSCVAAASGKPDALSIIDALTPEQYPNIVMVQLGYNDDPNTFQSDVDQVVNSLTARGVQRGEAVCLARDLAHTPGQDQLQLQRMKKRKLLLKDQIRHLELQLTPDIPA